MRKRSRRKHGSRPWLNANINGSDFTVSGFKFRVNCKIHVIKHVLGFVYRDSFWDKERWDQLFYGATFDRNQVIGQLLAVDCPAAKRRDEIREPNSMFTCDEACKQCQREDPSRCNKVLDPLIDRYQEVIKEALYYSHKLPRFTWHIAYTKMAENYQALEGMYHLDSRGIFVASRGGCGALLHKLHVVTCWRPVPPIDTRWCEGCLDYAKKMCLNHNLVGRIKMLALYNEETWGFKIMSEGEQSTLVRMRSKSPVSPKGQRKPERARTSYTLYGSLDERSRSLLDSLRKSLAQGKEKRENQRSQ